MKYLMALDQGTTSSRCIIFDAQARIVSVGQKEITQYYPHDGWVEHDPMEILQTQIGSAKEALEKAGLTASDIASIGITNQRETTILWDKHTGKPYCPAVVWQCRRTADLCKDLRAQGIEPMISAHTGLLLDPYFSATKIRWILDNVPEARAGAERGDALFGTVDSWLIWNLSGGKVHVTDATNASRTMLYHIGKLCWDEDLLNLFGIPRGILPEVVDSSGQICYTAPEIFGGPILISGIAGDQQAAAFGQGCHTPESCKCTYGTGCFLLLNTGPTPALSGGGLLSTVAWKIGDQATYAEEGSVFIGGAAVQWLRDQMKLIDHAGQSEREALKVTDSGGVYVVPAFTGLGAPYWEPDARGIITGITRATDRSHIVRATLESIAYQVQDLLTLMQDKTGFSIPRLNVDGGASKNDLLMQFQADIGNISVMRPTCTETTALGAALLAGLSSGVYSSLSEIGRLIESERIFFPTLDENTRRTRLAGWDRAIAQCKAGIER